MPSPDNGMVGHTRRWKGGLMTAKRARRTGTQTATKDRDLRTAIRAYVYAYVQRHGRQQAAHALGVSRTTLWRCLARGHVDGPCPAQSWPLWAGT